MEGASGFADEAEAAEPAPVEIRRQHVPREAIYRVRKAQGDG